MSKYRKVTREDHDAFCVVEGWELVGGATGKPVTHHRTYEFPLPDGRILRTRISRPVDRTEYRDSMWSHILRTQLQVTADEFWNCVNDNVKPQRGPTTSLPHRSLPLYLVTGLSRYGVSAQEISGMSEEEATRRLHQFWSAGD